MVSLILPLSPEMGVESHKFSVLNVMVRNSAIKMVVMIVWSYAVKY